MTTKKTVSAGKDIHADTGQATKAVARDLDQKRLYIKRLKQFRQRAGLTQEQAAARLGVDPATISRMERGLVVDLTIERLHSLASVYKTSIAEFLNPAILGSGVHAAVAIPRLTAAALLSQNLDGLRSLLDHWRGRTEVVGQALAGYFCVELSNDGRVHAIPPRALAVVDPVDRSLEDDGVYLLIHEGAVLARRYQALGRLGQFVAPSSGEQIPRPILMTDGPEIVGRIVSSIVSHKEH